MMHVFSNRIHNNSVTNGARDLVVASKCPPEHAIQFTKLNFYFPDLGPFCRDMT